LASNRAPWQQGEILEYQSAVGARRGDEPAVEAHRSARWRQERCDQHQQRALAAARGPHDGDEFAIADRKIDIAECQERAAALCIGKAQMFEIEPAHVSKTLKAPTGRMCR